MTDTNDKSFSADREYEINSMAVTLVASFVSHNSIKSDELPDLFLKVRKAIGGEPEVPVLGGTVEKPSKAEIKRSVTNDALISFIDGQPYKTLKRHLRRHGLDPRGYRERYGLPEDYPIVAPSYSEKRSALAKSLGLGQRATAEAA
jgi:predicted transcriptional regulator